jgi:hypothetical protein
MNYFKQRSSNFRKIRLLAESKKYEEMKINHDQDPTEVIVLKREGANE